MEEENTMTTLSVLVDDDDRQSSEASQQHEVGLKRLPCKIVKARFKPPTVLETATGSNKLCQDHYFTAAAHINDTNKRDIHTEKSPFRYPEDLEEFSYKVMSKAWRDSRNRQEAKLKYNERYSYQFRQKLDLLNRLYVKEPTIEGMKTILDVDPDFFTIIEGRPVDQKFNRRDYIRDVRDVLRLKIITGYREDEILLIEENFLAEQRLIDDVTKEFQKYVNAFEEFLFQDHSSAMALLKQAEEEAKKAEEKYEIHGEISKKYGITKSIVYNLEEKWRNCKMCQKFLYLVSPIEWRRVHDFYHLRKSSVDGVMEIEEDVDLTTVFDRYKLAASGAVLSIENLIDQFMEDVHQQNEPQLYFTDPHQLLQVFAFIEMQNLNSLLHSEELAIPLLNVIQGMEKINFKFDTEMIALQEIIDSLEGGIIWEEERAKYLEELALELINGDFRHLISDDDVINLHVFVEEVFDTGVGMNDSNISMGEMMKLVELTYRDFLLDLDRLPSTYVYKAEMECYREEAKIVAVSIDAAKKVVQLERLIKHLARLLQPSDYVPRRQLVWRSKPKDKLKRPPPPPQPLTEEETDYLTFFSEYCHHTDNFQDFGIRVHKVEKVRPSSDGDKE